MSQAFHHHPHWTAVERAMNVLKKAGFEALLAGGCVRDLIMCRTPNDFDIATTATPDELKPLFPHALEIGREFGVTILPEDGFQLEIATFRKDGPYLDGRRPSSVEFSDAEADAARRDFTVNALFYDLFNDKIFDFVKGQTDIKARLIRTVGKPDQRFKEDKLRLLRAVRFAAQLDFQIDPETFAAVQRLAPTLKVVSRERVRDEMVKLMKSNGRVRGLNLLFESGLLYEIILTFPRDPKIQQHVLKSWSSLVNVTANPVIFWSLLLKHCFNSEAELKKELKQLTFPIQQINTIAWILKNSADLAQPRTTKLSTLIRALANENSAGALQFQVADQGAMLNEDVSFISEVREKYLEQKKNLPAPWINGADLQSLGMKPGPKIGEILERAYNEQLEKKFASREELLASLKV